MKGSQNHWKKNERNRWQTGLFGKLETQTRYLHMLRIQEKDLNALKLKINDAKSKLTSDQADLSKLAIRERIFWIEILNKFLNEWIKEDAIWDAALDGDYTIVLKENNRDVIAWQHKAKNWQFLLNFNYLWQLCPLYSIMNKDST